MLHFSASISLWTQNLWNFMRRLFPATYQENRKDRSFPVMWPTSVLKAQYPNSKCTCYLYHLWHTICSDVNIKRLGIIIKRNSEQWTIGYSTKSRYYFTRGCYFILDFFLSVFSWKRRHKISFLSFFPGNCQGGEKIHFCSLFLTLRGYCQTRREMMEIRAGRWNYYLLLCKGFSLSRFLSLEETKKKSVTL